jgi:hypothetical protein
MSIEILLLIHNHSNGDQCFLISVKIDNCPFIFILKMDEIKIVNERQ